MMNRMIAILAAAMMCMFANATLAQQVGDSARLGSSLPQMKVMNPDGLQYQNGSECTAEWNCYRFGATCDVEGDTAASQATLTVVLVHGEMLLVRYDSYERRKQIPDGWYPCPRDTLISISKSEYQRLKVEGDDIWQRYLDAKKTHQEERAEVQKLLGLKPTEEPKIVDCSVGRLRARLGHGLDCPE